MRPLKKNVLFSLERIVKDDSTRVALVADFGCHKVNLKKVPKTVTSYLHFNSM